MNAKKEEIEKAIQVNENLLDSGMISSSVYKEQAKKLKKLKDFLTRSSFVRDITSKKAPNVFGKKSTRRKKYSKKKSTRRKKYSKKKSTRRR